MAAKRILVGYAARYAGYATVEKAIANPGIATYTTLDESVWIIPLAWAFDLIGDDLPDDDRDAISGKLLAPAAEHLVRHHYGRLGNFACWHNAAIGTLGLTLGRSDLIDRALHGAFGFDMQMQQGVLGDGLWFEGSFSYHFYALAACLALVQATCHTEHDLRNHPAPHAMLSAPLSCAYPDGSLPATNDCWYFTSLVGDVCHGVPPAAALYELGYSWYGDSLFGKVLHWAYQHRPRDSAEALLFGREDVPNEGVPPLPSVNMADSGYAILRPPAEPPSARAGVTYLLLKYGPHGGVHGHPDKLSLILHAHGQRLAPDLGTPSYGLDLFGSWYRQTVSHNTVTLDGQSQPPATGRLVSFQDDGPFQIADAMVTWDAAGDAGGYDGVALRRIVLARPDYFLDLYLVEGVNPHRIDWLHRAAGACRASIPMTALTRPTDEPGFESNGGHGYRHITRARKASISDDLTLSWRSRGSGVRLWIAGLPGSELILGRVPGNPPPASQTLAIVRRRVPQTAILSVVHPYAGRPHLTSVKWLGRDLLGAGWAGCIVHIGKRREAWLIRARPEAEIDPAAGYEDADVRWEYHLFGNP